MVAKCKCVICGKEWDWFDYKTGSKIVEPGAPMMSSGIDVCVECRPVVYKFRERFEENQREMGRIMTEWYKTKKFR